MMLRNRSRAVTSKPVVVADQASMLSPIRTFSCSPISPFLGSPRFFNGYLSKNPSDSETLAVSGPVSIRDTKNSTLFVNPFDRNHPKSSTPSPESPDRTNKAIGLALIDSIVEEKSEELFSGNFSKPISRMVLLGSRLKVQIPATNYPAAAAAVQPPVSPVDSPKSPVEFGTKTRSPQLASPLSRPSHLIRQLSLKEMELSEDYTCVITHGPNPKTKHIFDEYIVESCCCWDDDDDDDDDRHGVHTVSSYTEEVKDDDSTSESNPHPSDSSDFLSFCYFCKDVLHPDKELYLYRGEKGHECRPHETMLLGKE